MRKTYVIGFDGATWRFIRPLVEKGEMPNFQRMMQEGAYGDLMSTIPFQSAAAWVTFMTGKNSGHHGVYMFQDYDATSYSYVGRTAKPCMPPPTEGPLTPEEFALIRLWIDQGAKAPTALRVRPKIVVTGLPANVHPVRAVAVSPEGRTAFSGGADGTIRRWTLLG